jgi:hypothetical protein
MNSGKACKLSAEYLEDVSNTCRRFVAATSWVCKPKIKMTKTLPSDEGYYYYRPDYSDDVEIVYVEISPLSERMVIVRPHCGNIPVNSGYWAKVDESMFEFEGE